MNIIDAIRDENLFRPFFDGELKTWRAWLSALRTLYGLPIRPFGRSVIEECTGRLADRLPRDGFNQALFLTGRRSGKSRIAAVIGAYEAVLAGHETKLSKGEQGLVPVIAPTRRQAQIVKGYLRGVFTAPMLAAEIANETRDGFQLRNGVAIEVLSGDWRTVRGFTLLAAIVDEAAFLGLESEAKVRSDTELIRALKPALATVGGRLVAISSPYAKRGWCYREWKNHFANDAAKTLVWNCPSRTMNPTLSQSVVDDAMAEDRAAALSEYFGEFRDDVATFIPRDIVERLVAFGRAELLPHSRITYSAFVDMSGGRADSATLAIAHKEKDSGKVVLDYLGEWKPPFSPQAVIEDMSQEVSRFGLNHVCGDAYAAEYTASGFRAVGIRYVASSKSKNELYMELLPRLCSGDVELLDNPRLVDQLSNLERRTRSGGRDIVDHPPGEHDDLANAAAGVVSLASVRRIRLGAIR